jgi:FlaA1/EpsC-like NDP-sugar epimerase
VAGSRGSVVPIFSEQIRNGREVTLTDDRMTRFVMTLDEAARLVIDTMPIAIGGEIFIAKMPVVSIEKLARVMIRLIAPLFGRPAETVKIRTIGPRAGEKLWEELNSDEEVRRTLDLGSYLVVLPALRHSYDYKYGLPELSPVTKTYHSSNEVQISEEEIERFLLRPGVLSDDIRVRLAA